MDEPEQPADSLHNLLAENQRLRSQFEQTYLRQRVRELAGELSQSAIPELLRMLQDLESRASGQEKAKLSALRSLIQQDPEAAARIVLKWKAYPFRRLLW